METSSKINLIYIASIGRSGSTLLESILGAHSQISTCGELHIWPHEIELSGVRPCSCGRSVLECSFWSEMNRRVDPIHQPQPQIHFFRERHNAGKTLRFKQIKFFKTDSTSLSNDEKIKKYGENNEEVFSEFMKLTYETEGYYPTWIVDASKDPYRLLWLIRSKRFNIKVLHIVKNPSAFIYSVTKGLMNDRSISGFKHLFYDTARQSIKWSIENYLISKIAQDYLKDDDYLLINYEILASKPLETFKTICNTVGCPFEENAVIDFRKGSLHTIAGNPMRYEKKGIVLDEKWKIKLPKLNIFLVKALTQLNSSKYGY